MFCLDTILERYIIMCFIYKSQTARKLSTVFYDSSSLTEQKF